MSDWLDMFAALVRDHGTVAAIICAILVILAAAAGAWMHALTEAYLPHDVDEAGDTHAMLAPMRTASADKLARETDRLLRAAQPQRPSGLRRWLGRHRVLKPSYDGRPAARAGTTATQPTRGDSA